jgi:hypothetical protein
MYRTLAALAFVSVLSPECAFSQTTLGELLDAGAAKLTIGEFNEEVVQRMLAGPTAAGGAIEVMYATNGAIHGTGTYRAMAHSSQVSGEWKVDDEGKDMHEHAYRRRTGPTDRVGRAARTLPVLVPARTGLLLLRFRHRSQRARVSPHAEAMRRRPPHRRVASGCANAAAHPESQRG